MNRKIILIFLYSYAFVFSVLKTIRLPNQWSEAHWMLDYRFGFIKRGFAGEAFAFFFNKNEFNIIIVSVVILLLLYAAVFVIAIKQIYKNNYSIYSVLFFLIFFLSQYIILSAHVIGYLDHIVFLFAILVIYLIKRKIVFISSVLISIAVLIHEITFFLVLPISFFTLVVTSYSGDQFSLKSIVAPAMLKKIIVLATLPFITILAVFVYQDLYGKNNYDDIITYLKQIQFIKENVANSVAVACTESFGRYLNEESGHFIQRLFLSKCTIIFGIPILFSLFMVYRNFKKINIDMFLLLAAVSVFPLVLHIIALDTFRIWSYPFMILFLGFWIVNNTLETEQGRVERLSGIEYAFFILSLLLVALVPNLLFDEEVERFSLPLRLVMLMPILACLYLLNKGSIQEN